MIVTASADQYRLITQNDHSRQVGRLARHWGNDRFEPPAPHQSMIIAAAIHDNGWWAYDLQPRLVDGAPGDILDVPADAWRSFYDRAAERTAEIDPYAGLLVSMHGAGVRRQRYGIDSSLPDFSDEYAQFITDQEARQMDLMAEMGDSARFQEYATAEERTFLADLHTAGSADGLAAEATRIWTNYKLLQVWDQLSLYFCWNFSLEEETLAPVPVGRGGEDVDLRIEPVDAFEARLDPYPFDTSPLSVPVPGRLIPNDDYTEPALVEAYYTTDPDRFEFTVRR